MVSSLRETESEQTGFSRQQAEAIGLLIDDRLGLERKSLRLKPLAVEPLKKRKGLIAYADGTNWDPGSGEGVYVYNGTLWVQL